MRFAFAGTPRLGAWVLSDLTDEGLLPTLVISQPDRPAGRGRRLAAPPVVEEARRRGLPVHQTDNVNSAESLGALRDSGAEALVVAAFGHLLRQELLEGWLCLNVHASLLPAYRGAAPIVRALMDGVRETGVTIMRMAPGLDDGPWAEMTRLSVGPRTDAGRLGRSLALLGAQGIAGVMRGVEEGAVGWTPQEGVPSYAPKVGPADRILDLTATATACHDRVRALSPEIGCEVQTDSGLHLKVWRSWPWGSRGPAATAVPAPAARADGDALDAHPVAPEGLRAEEGLLPAAETGLPGRLVTLEGRLFVASAQGWLELLSLQPSGKRAMSAAEFLRGYGARLGARITPAGEA